MHVSSVTINTYSFFPVSGKFTRKAVNKCSSNSRASNILVYVMSFNPRVLPWYTAKSSPLGQCRGRRYEAFHSH